MVRIVDGQILPDLPDGGGGGHGRARGLPGRARWGASVHTLGGSGDTGRGSSGSTRDEDGDGDGEQAYFGGDSTSFLGGGGRERGGHEGGERAERSSYDGDDHAGNNFIAPTGREPGLNASDGDQHFTDELQDMLCDATWGAQSTSHHSPLVPATPTAVCCAIFCPCLGIHLGGSGGGASVAGCCPSQTRAAWTRVLSRRIVPMIALLELALLAIGISSGGLLPWSRNMLLGPPPNTWRALGALPPVAPSTGTGSGTGTGTSTSSSSSLLAHEPWRVMTALLLHGGILHAAFNIFVSIRLALPLEERWGSPRYSRIWLMAGAIGALWSCRSAGAGADADAGAASPAMLVCASVPTYGVLGAWLVEVLCAWDDLASDTRRAAGLLLPVAVSLLGVVQTIEPTVPLSAHVVGFATGALLGVGAFDRPAPLPHMLEIPRAMRIRQLVPRAATYVVGATLVLLTLDVAHRLWAPPWAPRARSP